jgi:hypothetical protein
VRSDIGVHHCRMPAPRVLREVARLLAQDYNTLLALAGAADTAIQKYLEAYSQHTEAVITLLRAALQRQFHG